MTSVYDLCSFEDVPVLLVHLTFDNIVDSLRGRQNTPPTEQMLIGGFCMRKRTVVSTVATPHPSNHLRVSYLGLALRVRGVLGG